MEAGFEKFFKIHKISREKLVPKLQSKISKESLEFIHKNKSPNVSSFQESVIKHKLSFKKSLNCPQTDSSSLVPLSELINAQNIGVSVVMEYERLLVLCLQMSIVSRNHDLLNHLLSFFDCFQFREADFRVAWGFYAVFLREFGDARSSFEFALKRDPQHWLALLGFGVIYLSGGSNWVPLEEALSKTHRSVSARPTSQAFQNLSRLYSQKGLLEDALVYQMQAFQDFLTTHEIDLDFLILDI